MKKYTITVNDPNYGTTKLERKYRTKFGARRAISVLAKIDAMAYTARNEIVMYSKRRNGGVMYVSNGKYEWTIERV